MKRNVRLSGCGKFLCMDFAAYSWQTCKREPQIDMRGLHSRILWELATTAAYSLLKFACCVLQHPTSSELCPTLELDDIPQKNRKEGIFAIPVSISSKKFYTGKPTYRKNTGIP